MILRGNFCSDILHMYTNIQVFIPEQCKNELRIIYLLHGLHGDQATWIDRTMLPVYAGDYNAIFVMPEAARSFYLNLKYGRRYFDYVSEELPDICRRIFKISAKREDTAVMGCSMGGYGSLFLSLTKSEQYGFCGAISPACIYFKPLLDAVRENPEGLIKSRPDGKELLVDLQMTYGEGLEYRKEYDIVELVKKFPQDKPKPRIFVTCGTEDDLRKENLKFRDEMQNTDFDFAYEEWSGDHDWYFFSDALKRTLDAW